MGERDVAPRGAKWSVELATPGARSETARRWPEIASLPEPNELWVARETGSGMLRGAAVLDLYPLPFRLTGRAVRLFRGSESDDAGVSAALVQSAEQTVRDLGLKALFAGDSVVVGSDAWREWQSLGFVPNRKLGHYDVALAAYLDMLTPLYDALTLHGRVPIEGRVIPLREAPLGDVIQLQIENIGGDAGRLEMRLRGGGYYPFDPDLSHVAMLDGRVCGFLLAQVDRHRRLTVESKVVAPAHRRSWVNVAIMHEAAQEAVRKGYSRVRFVAHQRQRDTHRLAAKAGPAMHRRDVMVRGVEHERR